MIQNDCFFITLQQWWGPLNLLLASTSSLSSQWGRQQRDVRDAISLSLSPAQVEVESRGGKQKLLAKKDPKIPLPPLAYPMWAKWVKQATELRTSNIISSQMLRLSSQQLTKTMLSHWLKGILFWDFHSWEFRSQDFCSWDLFLAYVPGNCSAGWGSISSRCKIMDICSLWLSFSSSSGSRE